MPDAERRPPRRARGKTKRYTEAQLDKLAEVTPDDIESAQDRWSQGNDGFDNLLDAQPEDDES